MRRKDLIQLAAIGLAVWAAYSGSLDNAFTFDDWGIIVDNPLIRQAQWRALLTEGYWWGGTGQETGLYRPITMVSYALNSGQVPSPAAFHLVNLLLHCGACLALWWGSRALLHTQVAFWGALLFAVHPALSEAVAAVVGRADILAVGCGWLGLGCVMRYLRGAGYGYALAGWAALAGAGLAKENGLVFGLGLGLWLALGPGAGWVGGRRVHGLGICAGATAIPLGLKWTFVGQFSPGTIGFIDNPLAYAENLWRALNGMVHLARYGRLGIWPRPLAADYSYDQLPVWTAWSASELLWPLLMTATGAGLLVYVLGRSRSWALIALVCGGGLLAVSNVLLPIGTVFAERLLYLPLSGGCLFFAWALAHIRPAGLGYVLLGVWVGVGSGLTRRQVEIWSDDVALFGNAVAVSPRSARSHFGLGLAVHRAGRPAEALASYDRALAIYPRYAEAHYNRGAALLGLKRYTEALEAYRQAVASRPAYIEALYAQASVSHALGRSDEALGPLQKILELKPEHTAAQALKARLEREGGAKDANRDARP